MTTISFDPRTGGVNGETNDSSASDVSAAVDRALAVSRAVAATCPVQRREWLYAVATAFEDHADELVPLAESETGLGRPRLEAEVSRTAGQLRFYGDVAVEGSFVQLTVDDKTNERPGLVKLNQPLGPVAVFGASNFPFAFGVLGNDTASAIAAGCPVVAKAHPAHPLLSDFLEDVGRQALRGAGAPSGIFAMVRGLEAGLALVRAPAIRAVAFTGSQAGGLALWREVNEREVVVPIFAEMGTVNPVLITHAATHRLGDIAGSMVASFTLGSGQYCTKPGLVLAPAGSGFADAVARALADAEPEPVMLTSHIAEAVTRGIRELEDAGAEVAIRIPPRAAGWTAPAAVMTAPISALAKDSRLLEECFGAVCLVVEYADEASLIEAVSRLQNSLTGSVFTAASGMDDAEAAIGIALLADKVGRVTVNDWPTGVAVAWAQQHGGPWPATSCPTATSVGAGALDRFVRPVAYQSTRDEWLPEAARAANPWTLPLRRNGQLIAPAGESQ